MENTVQQRPDDDSFNALAAQTIVQTIGTAFAQGAASQADAAKHQADTVKHQADAQVQIAKSQSDTQVSMATISAETERMHLKFAAWVTVGGLVFIAGVVGASFVVGRYEIATHALTAVAGGVAGWLAGRSKR
jgi:hypothetical protein